MIRSALYQNRFLLIMICCVALSGTALLHVSQNVYSQKKQVQSLNTQISKTEKEIKSLNAEIAYLSSPERLDHITSAMPKSSKSNDVPIVMTVNHLADAAPFQTIIPSPKPYIAKASSQNFASILDNLGGER